MNRKALYASLVTAGLLVVVGCNTSSTGGNPGQAGGTFKLEGPGNTPETSVKQGETVVKDINVKPEKNFKEDVALAATVEPADKGVTAKLEPMAWKAGEPKPVKLHITASDKADAGEYTIRVKGTPAKGSPTEVDVKIKVKAK